MTSEHDSRPRPQYGEYADPAPEPQARTSDEAPSDPATAAGNAAEDAGSQKPSFGIAAQDWARGEDQSQNEAGPGQGSTEPPATTPATAPAPAQHVAQRHSNASGPLPGVPHNLGAKGSTGLGVQTAPRTTGVANPGDPENRATPNAAEGVSPASASTPQDAPAAARKGSEQARPRGADRIATIVLLAIGSYFALSMALTLSQFSLEFSKIADELGVKDFAAPPALKTLGTVGAILVLAIYALVLIFSIRRLRARKVTFWAPLVAGALAWVIFFVLFFVGLNQSAELWEALLNIASDPAAAQQMIERLNSTS